MPHFLTDVLPYLHKFSDRTLLKIYTGTPSAPSWSSITYGTFVKDMERLSCYWQSRLRNIGLAAGDVIGLWITGYAYSDIVSLYAVSRAGFVPLMLSRAIAVQGGPVVVDMLRATGGTALLYDNAFFDHVKDIPLPCVELVSDMHSIPATPLPDLPAVGDDDVAIIFHTSGSTAGKPKPIRETHRWLRCHEHIQWPTIWQGGDTPAVMNNIGSFANVGSGTSIPWLARLGHCTIQTPKPDFDHAEFMELVRNGLNHVLVYSPWLSKLIAMARADDQVLKAMKDMLQMTYTGAALDPEDKKWIVANGIKAVALYASTEGGCCLASRVSETAKLPSMKIIEGMKCQLIPKSDINKTDLDADSEKRTGTGMLYDCFIPADADNCPHPLTRNRPDGHITGDLFEETAPGYYAFRGRNDDWIRTGKLKSFCDTKSIEDNVRKVCAGLVHNCVVVGHYKPCIVLLVEPSSGDPDDHVAMDGLKQKILDNIQPFNNRLYEHERINSTRQIMTVPCGSLPRTMDKGNIRRKAAEDQHTEALEESYNKLKAW